MNESAKDFIESLKKTQFLMISISVVILISVLLTIRGEYDKAKAEIDYVKGIMNNIDKFVNHFREVDLEPRKGSLNRNNNVYVFTGDVSNFGIFNYFKGNKFIMNSNKFDYKDAAISLIESHLEQFKNVYELNNGDANKTIKIYCDNKKIIPREDDGNWKSENINGVDYQTMECSIDYIRWNYKNMSIDTYNTDDMYYVIIVSSHEHSPEMLTRWHGGNVYDNIIDSVKNDNSHEAMEDGGGIAVYRIEIKYEFNLAGARSLGDKIISRVDNLSMREELKSGKIREVMKNLDAYSKAKNDEVISSLAKKIVDDNKASRRKDATDKAFTVVGMSIPLNYIYTWGLTFLTLSYLYFIIHYLYFVKKFDYKKLGHLYPWVGLYSGIIFRGFFTAMLAIPFVSATLIVFHQNRLILENQSEQLLVDVLWWTSLGATLILAYIEIFVRPRKV